MRILVWLVVNALALGAAVFLVGGITLTANDDAELLLHLVVAGAILGAVNGVVRPLVRVLSIPFIVLTLGLFWLVINALMLMLASAIAEGFELGLQVTGFGAALLGSVVISLSLMVLEAVLPARKRR